MASENPAGVAPAQLADAVKKMDVKDKNVNPKKGGKGDAAPAVPLEVRAKMTLD